MKRLVVINAGTGNPSSTRQLTDRLAQKALDRLDGEAVVQRDRPRPARRRDRPRGRRRVRRRGLQAAIDKLAAADGIIAATPIYKAGMSGLFKTFVDVLDNDLLVAKPILLAATGGTPRHALVIDDQLRPLFAYMRALTLPDFRVRGAGGLGLALARRTARSRGDRARRDGRGRRGAADRRQRLGRATSTSSAATPREPSRPRTTSTSAPG